MYASAELTAAAERWRVTAENLISEAERIGTLAGGVFGPLGTDEEGGAVEATIDAEVEALIAQGERQLAALDNATEESADARFQATSLLVGTLAISEALAAADGAPFGGLSIEGAQAEVFADARATVAETAAVVAVPASLKEGLEKLEVAGATESWEVVSGSVGKLAGGALVSGLEGVLKGAAAAAFAQLKKQLSGFVNVLKRAVVRITEWVVEKLKSLLPKSLAEKVDDLVSSVQELIIGRASEFATDVYGGILGRAKTEDAWRTAAEAGHDLTAAEGKIGDVISSHTGRIAWVTKARGTVDKFDSVVAGLVGAAQTAGQIAFAALVATVLGFIAFQVWDGFNDVEELV